MVWNGSVADFGHLNGARRDARLTLWIVFLWNVGRRPLHGVDHFGWGRVSWLRGRDSQPSAVETRALSGIGSDLKGKSFYIRWINQVWSTHEMSTMQRGYAG